MSLRYLGEYRQYYHKVGLEEVVLDDVPQRRTTWESIRSREWDSGEKGTDEGRLLTDVTPRPCFGKEGSRCEGISR